MDQFENQQKRIAFLSLHGHLMSAVKQEKELDGKKHIELCDYIFTIIESLFKKYPVGGSKEEKPTIKKTDEFPG